MLQVMMEFESKQLTEESIDWFFNRINAIQTIKNGENLINRTISKVNRKKKQVKQISTNHKLIYINARSILKNIEKIELLACKYKPYLILCSEARITEEIIISEYQIENYTAIECFSSSRHTGGVQIYIKKELKHKMIINKNIDTMLWFLSFEIWDSKINGIYNVFYRSPNARVNVEESIMKLDEILEQTINLNKLNVITEDLNIDLRRDNQFTRLIQNIISRHGLILSVNFNTRENENNGTLIDVVLTNESEKVECEPLINEHISDHQTILININDCKNEEFLDKINVLSWKNYTKEKLIDNLRGCEWAAFYSSNINDKVRILRENLLNSVMPLVNNVEIKNNITQKNGLIMKHYRKREKKL